MSCDHDGFHTGQGRYDPPAGRLRYVMVCEDCHQEIGEVHEEAYTPKFDPDGNDGYRNAA